MYKIYGNPRTVIYDTLNRHRPVMLDDNGEAVIEDSPFAQRIIQRLKYEIVDGTLDKAEEITAASERVYSCKKCEYTTANKGELMYHYRQHKAKGE